MNARVPAAGSRAADALDALARDLAQVTAIAREVDSAPLTTYRAGGPIALLVEVESTEALIAVSGRLASWTGEVVVVGRGSNLLVADAGFDGVAVRLGPSFEGIDSAGAHEASQVRAGGATALPVLARQTAKLGLRGLEFYVGIPGSVGGAIRMNAGGHGAETVDVLARAAILTLGESQINERTPDELGLTFRHSNLGDRDVVVAATFRAERGEAGAARAEIDEIVRWRRANQPGGQNCGSVFVNPPGDSAGRLIDAAGLKGTRIGGAIVSPKHANFVQADAGTRAADVVALITHVRDVVHETFGVVLRPELRLVGFAPHVLTGAGDPPDGPPGVEA
jgi:UDP-N-acetylmuramate dehydrogenase